MEGNTKHILITGVPGRECWIKEVFIHKILKP